ncbi:MAG: type II toxin-antitoxin system Phd/YefM family antitoxin [Oscillospiraceae bacterium]|nr:type II toxin-antitoxin system Phd/YefM family antitoxin [Oscillospiraceae bacterium]
MFSTHIKAVRDLRNNYPEIATIIKKRDNVIITNNGKSEAVIISYEEYAKYEEYLHIRYTKEKLAEAEALVGKTGAWIDSNELFKEWDAWDAVKL